MRGYVLVWLLVTGAVLVAAAERHKRLTSFGKAPEKKTPGKDCKTDSECPVEYASCKEDVDGKKRCICEGGSYPVSGRCERYREKRGYVPKGNSQPKKEGMGVTLFKPATPQFFPQEGLTTRKPLFIPEKQIVVPLREFCQSNAECITGAECKIHPNATTPQQLKTKVCLCSEDTVEEDGECNGCIRLQTSGWMLLVLGLTSIAALRH